jgi:hypothetical protein
MIDLGPGISGLELVSESSIMNDRLEGEPLADRREPRQPEPADAVAFAAADAVTFAGTTPHTSVDWFLLSQPLQITSPPARIRCISLKPP